MKTIDCQHCEAHFTADTKEAILGVLYDHYMKDHTQIITTIDEAGKQAWMQAFEARWQAAPESD